MKRLLSILAIVAIFSLSIIAALSIIPHVHGDDLDHSHHESCPLHQFNLANPTGNFAIFEAITFLFFALFLISYYHDDSVSSNYTSIKFFSSRAPPAVL